ncbi:MAG: hypothetical protein CM15mP49_21910 [Actinomycetota bacterium]|nr:MAG: hypothetical protein CM15mP49_21910 [Actinomycetota bacterium]
MKSVVVGSGGREHALAHVLGRDSDVTVTPGNPGIPNSTTQSHSILMQIYLLLALKPSRRWTSRPASHKERLYSAQELMELNLKARKPG